MNPWDLSVSDLLIWGLVLHLIADWPFQNDWMANNKMKRRHPDVTWFVSGVGNLIYTPNNRWWRRHPSAYVHAGIHGLFLALVFGWVAVPLALTHLIIDCRWPVAKWSKFVGQIQPKAPVWATRTGLDYDCGADVKLTESGRGGPLVDLGMMVRIWTDQVFHIACIAIAALAVTL